jgi:hypothetical protein
MSICPKSNLAAVMIMCTSVDAATAVGSQLTLPGWLRKSEMLTDPGRFLFS